MSYDYDAMERALIEDGILIDQAQAKTLQEIRGERCHELLQALTVLRG